MIEEITTLLRELGPYNYMPIVVYANAQFAGVIERICSDIRRDFRELCPVSICFHIYH